MAEPTKMQKYRAKQALTVGSDVVNAARRAKWAAAKSARDKKKADARASRQVYSPWTRTLGGRFT